MLNLINFAKGFANMHTALIRLHNLNSNSKKVIDVQDKLEDMLQKVMYIDNRIKQNLDLNQPENKLHEIVCRFADNKELKDSDAIAAAYIITKGIYYPLPRR